MAGPKPEHTKGKKTRSKTKTDHIEERVLLNLLDGHFSDKDIVYLKLKQAKYIKRPYDDFKL
jgi:hypothetical protein